MDLSLRVLGGFPEMRGVLSSGAVVGAIASSSLRSCDTFLEFKIQVPRGGFLPTLHSGGSPFTFHLRLSLEIETIHAEISYTAKHTVCEVHHEIV